MTSADKLVRLPPGVTCAFDPVQKVTTITVAGPADAGLAFLAVTLDEADKLTTLRQAWAERDKALELSQKSIKLAEKIRDKAMQVAQSAPTPDGGTTDPNRPAPYGRSPGARWLGFTEPA